MRAKKRYGQHFLEAVWADKLVAAIDPKAGDRFVEIGPGPGALTLRLAPLVSRVTAVELDAEMVARLRPRLPPNVVLVHGDFLEFDLSTLASERPFRVAGNLPYNVSSPILFALIDTHRTADGIIDATLMVQREVAERMHAQPGTGDYGVLSILVQLHADVRLVLSLPPGAFRPMPRVHSSVVHLHFRAPAITLADEPAFESMVRTMFMQRRKTLRNALGPYAESRQRSGAVALAAAGIDPRRRPETLQLSELARLAEFFSSAGGGAVL
jgi:16S rRNA (adenine1518-N6/adenine1519-N6)-dimethyltransferase